MNETEASARTVANEAELLEVIVGPFGVLVRPAWLLRWLSGGCSSVVAFGVSFAFDRRGGVHRHGELEDSGRHRCWWLVLEK